MAKLYDLCVKTRSYTDKEGSNKNVWENIGTIMEGNDGGRYIMLRRTFNAAGVPNPDNRDTLLVSMFKVKEHGSTSSAIPDDDVPPIGDEDIPF